MRILQPAFGVKLLVDVGFEAGDAGIVDPGEAGGQGEILRGEQSALDVSPRWRRGWRE